MTAALNNTAQGNPFASGVDSFVYPQLIGDAKRAPTTNDIYNPGTRWQDNSVNPAILYFTTGAGLWYAMNGAGTFTNLTVTGNETVAGTLGVTGLSTLTGGINTAPVDVAAAASPQTANGRSGKVTFSGVSIAAGATQSFVINNTAIAAIGTDIIYSMVGATAGAALSIVSVTNVAATSSTIVITNGVGATTSTANITFTFLVLS
jgi:hypothetical protein